LVETRALAIIRNSRTRVRKKRKRRSKRTFAVVRTILACSTMGVKRYS
jgi:hypothetical protein